MECCFSVESYTTSAFLTFYKTLLSLIKSVVAKKGRGFTILRPFPVVRQHILFDLQNCPLEYVPIVLGCYSFYLLDHDLLPSDDKARKEYGNDQQNKGDGGEHLLPVHGNTEEHIPVGLDHLQQLSRRQGGAKAADPADAVFNRRGLYKIFAVHIAVCNIVQILIEPRQADGIQ